MKMQNAYLASEARGGPGGCGEERGQRWARYESQWPDLDFGSPGVRGGANEQNSPYSTGLCPLRGRCPKGGGYGEGKKREVVEDEDVTKTAMY